MKSDLRTVATTEETYFVDNQAYDAVAGATGTADRRRERHGNAVDRQRLTVTARHADGDGVLHRGDATPRATQRLGTTSVHAGGARCRRDRALSHAHEWVGP